MTKPTKRFASVCFLLLLMGGLVKCSGQQEHVAFVYPGGQIKALIMSYDDGTVDDIALIKLFDDNGIVGTFNLNSEFFGTTRLWPQKNADPIATIYVSKDSLLSIYGHHEIAAHSATHKDFLNLNDDEILREVRTDIANLSTLTKRKIISMAYPFGNANQHIAELTSRCGITNARTVRDTHAFDLPDTLLLWHPTCHDSKALELLDNYLSFNENRLSAFYVWGHSWEFNDAKRWDDICRFCRTIGNRKDIWYAGCGEFAEYQLALRKLRVTRDSVSNPIDNNRVWFKQGGSVKVLEPGRSMKAIMN